MKTPEDTSDDPFESVADEAVAPRRIGEGEVNILSAKKVDSHVIIILIVRHYLTVHKFRRTGFIY